MNQTRAAAIRASAYQLWIECGYADGQQDANWRQAEREIAEREASEEPTAAPTSATLLTMRTASADAPHSDGTSYHPSVLDPGLSRAAA